MQAIARRVPWAQADAKWVRTHRSALLARIGLEARRMTRPRTILLGKHEDDRRFALEAAVDPTER